MATNPNAVDDLAVVSNIKDPTPRLEWTSVEDAETGSADLTYEVKIMDMASATVYEATDIEGGSLGDTLQYDVLSMLSAGSYLAQVRAKDSDDDYSDWSSAVQFRVVTSIDKTKLVVVVPPYEDPTLGQVRFYNAVTQALWDKLKSLETIG